MNAQKLDGRKVAAQIKEELKLRVQNLQAQGVAPGLGTIIVGDDPGSRIYVDGKHRDCAEVGIKSMRIELPENASTADVISAVESFNASPVCTGFIVQLPLPAAVDTEAVLEKIAPEKDADGLHPINLGRLVLNIEQPLYSPAPCTPRGIVELGRRGGVSWDGANVCIVGQGKTAGRPLSLFLTRADINSTVDTCHIGTRDLAAHTRQADIVVAAAGVAHLIKPDMVKVGAAVFDVGVTRVQDPDGKTHVVGDVDPVVAQVAGYLSPNPGGVGPMTRAMLLVNIVEAAERQLS